ncbi:MAG: DNA gyrase subunit B [Clostridia bacterium]
MNLNKTYESKDIIVLEGLDAVRLRPGMYIGTTGTKGMHHILWEIVDNSIDELANGFGDTIDVKLYKDGSASVEDNGRGIPTDIHPQMKVSGVQVVFTQLHAGGKFNADNYNYSGGLHGVGASVTNALSEWLNVTVFRNKKKYEMSFKSYVGLDGKIKSGIPVTPLIETGTSKKSGTFIHFKPDFKVFGEQEFSNEIIAKHLKELAFLNKKIKLSLFDERTGNLVDYYYEGGVADFVKYLNESKNVINEKPVYIEGKTDLVELAMAFQYTDQYTESIFSYVNNIPTTEGGTHETGLKSAFTRVFNDVGRKFGFLKDKDPNYMGEDYREGLTCVLAIKMKNAQFEGQTKTKLGNPETKTEVESVVVTELQKYMENTATRKFIESIMQKAKVAAQVREQEKKAKELTRQKNSIDSANLVGKLSSCTGRKPELNELYIVEGDSAGGSAKQARDRSFQAILPLRGKPLNVEKKRLHQVLANEEIRSIISALGAGIMDDFDVTALKYHKVVILSDADQDGAHIRAILLTFFFRYMRNLINEGHVYIGMPPLYKVYKKDKVIYAYDDNNLQEAIDEVGKGYSIQRYKGLGEMNPEQLWETTMNPERRNLMQVSMEDAVAADKIITVLMGDDIESRKDYISEHANFEREDNFEKIGV